MSKPTLYGPTYSTYTRTLRMVLAEKGVDHDLVDVDMMTGAHQRPEWKERHPFERVPAFEHNGFTIYESNAIAHYIDDAFPGRRLAHPDVRRRIRDQQIVEVINAYGYKRIILDIVLRYYFADKEKGPDMAGSKQRCRPRSTC
jgi:glutathione S-transferase